jgi:dipeptidyl aminopeptidase/acylaminoacyl peptidase
MIAATLAATLLSGGVAIAESPPPLTVEALTGLRSMSMLWPIGSITRDGRWLAYALRAGTPPSRDGGSSYGAYGPTGMLGDHVTGTDLWLVDIHTGATERLTDGKGAVEEPVWTPDGEQLAFYADRDGAVRLWLWSRNTRELRRLSGAVARPSRFPGAHLRVTPDGRHLVALLLPVGMTVQQANVRRAKPALPDDPTIAPGSTVVVRRAALATDRGKAPTSMTGSTSTAIETSRFYADMEADLALVSLATGEIRRIGREKPVFWYAPSPDGKWIAYSYQAGRMAAASQPLFHTEVAPVNGGPTRVLAQFTYSDYNDGVFTWSPDGTRLAYVTSGKLAKGDVHVIDVVAGTDRNLTTTPHPTFTSEGTRGVEIHWTTDGRALLFVALGRLWRVPSEGGEALGVTPAGWDRETVQLVADAQNNGVWTQDGGRTVTVTTRNPVTKDVGFYRVELASGQPTRLREEAKRYGGRNAPAITSGDGTFVVYSGEDAQHPADLWGAGPDLADSRQLTHFNPEIERIPLGASRVIDYLGFDGRPLRAALLLPSNYQNGKPVPLIVYPYPGPSTHSDLVNAFFWFGSIKITNLQMLATRGYAVLFPEIPQRMGTPVADLVAGVTAAVNKAIELGIADPDCLGVSGLSYGGYATIALITQTQRFKAAVMTAGSANLISKYGQLSESGDGASWFETGQGLMGGSPWQYPRRYIENSPIFDLDRVTTPLLIVHGESDAAFLAEEVFVGLRRLGREAEYRKYMGEGHIPATGRENVTDYWNAVIRWFDTYLKTAPQPES